MLRYGCSFRFGVMVVRGCTWEEDRRGHKDIITKS